MATSQQIDPSDYIEPEADADAVWRQNYSTLAEHADKSLRSDGRPGEWRASTQDLTIASLGANRKEKPGGEVSARVLFDGTNGIAVNSRTRIRDQERAAIAADSKRSMREKASRGLRTLALTADVSEAHRQVPIAKRNWHLLGCRVVDGGTVYVTLWGPSASPRPLTACRGSHPPSGASPSTSLGIEPSRGTCSLPTTSFWNQQASLVVPRSSSFSHCVRCQAWSKTAGGDIVTWVGFELLHRSFQVGISARRAEWFSRWTRDTVSADHTHIGKFEEGFGRVVYVVGAPIPRSAVQVHVNPSSELRAPCPRLCFLYSPVSRPADTGIEALQLRCRAPSDGVSTPDGRAGPSISTWFSLEVLEEDWPWIFKKGNTPSLAISTLEALAVLMALKLFHGNQSAQHRTRILVCPTWTDNRGNGAALNRQMTTKFLASAVIMELAAFMKKELFKAQVARSPRSGNTEADALANGVHEGFDSILRLDIDPSSLPRLGDPSGGAEDGRARGSRGPEHSHKR